jgi:serine/threonine-protein kinase RsbW
VGCAIGVARRFSEASELPADAADRLAIIVEEWVVNLLEHGQLEPGSRIGMTLGCDDGLVRLTFSDAGVPFDPRSTEFRGPNPVRGGGVGLALIRAWSRIADYRRRAGRNQLTLEMPLG